MQKRTLDGRQKHNWKLIKAGRPSYTQLRAAWATTMEDCLGAFDWSLWITLTTKEPQPLKVIRGRFFAWLKLLRRIIKQHYEVIWIVERQRRGALHIHAVIGDIPPLSIWKWRAMINSWQTSGRTGQKFGAATIVKYDPLKAGKLANYLAKERCRDLDVIEGSGSIYEKFGYSRGVAVYRTTPLKLRTLRFGIRNATENGVVNTAAETAHKRTVETRPANIAEDSVNSASI